MFCAESIQKLYSLIVSFPIMILCVVLSFIIFIILNNCKIFRITAKYKQNWILELLFLSLFLIGSLFFIDSSLTIIEVWALSVIGSLLILRFEIFIGLFMWALIFANRKILSYGGVKLGFDIYQGVYLKEAWVFSNELNRYIRISTTWKDWAILACQISVIIFIMSNHFDPNWFGTFSTYVWNMESGFVPADLPKFSRKFILILTSWLEGLSFLLFPIFGNATFYTKLEYQTYMEDNSYRYDYCIYGNFPECYFSEKY